VTDVRKPNVRGSYFRPRHCARLLFTTQQLIGERRMSSSNKPAPWRERAFVSVTEAAGILGRSTSYVRDRLTDNTLKAGSMPTGIKGVDVRSLARLRLESLISEQTAPVPRLTSDASHLRVVSHGHAPEGRTSRRPPLWVIVGGRK
jgi:hypothetical protein